MDAPPRRRWTRLLLTAAAILVVAWLLTSLTVAYRLTRRAALVAAEPLPQWLNAAESLRLTTADGEELGAWFVPGRPGLPAVVVLHGNGERRGTCAEQARLLGDIGCPMLLVTLRAHGDSTGDTNDFGLSHRRDVTAAVGWLRERLPSRPVVIWGQSLGSAAALFAAEELGASVQGYILECPFADLRTAVYNRLRLRLPTPLALVAYAGLVTVAPLLLPLDDISPCEAASRVPGGTPALVLAGGRDSRARPDEARRIAARLRPAAEVVVFDEGDHVQLSVAEPGRYREVIAGFVRRFADEPRTE